jgi:hypothetical protein
VGCALGQEPSASLPPAVVLHAQSSLTTPLPPVGGIIGQIRCDAKGQIYFQPESGPLVRVSPDAQNIVAFHLDSVPELQPKSGASDYPQLTDFAVSPSGSVSVAAKLGQDAFVISFDSNGRYKSIVKLNIPGRFYPAGLAVFANETYLVSGEVAENSKSWKPFTGIFDSGGQLLSNISVRSDKTIMEEQSSPVRTAIPQIATGTVATSPDGNAYVMRRFANPIVYVVSPGGAILRTINIASPKGFVPVDMGLGGNRLIFTFQRRQDRTVEILYVTYDAIDGKEISRYERDEKLRGALACYTGDDFLFLGVVDGKRALIHARP